MPAATTWIDVPMLAGWSLALVSLFYFNRYSAWDSWAVYFFPYFFMGIVFHRALAKPGSQWMFRIYQLAIIAAMFGKTSYSLFLVHFPVLVLVAGAWARLGWTSAPAPAAVAGLLVAFAGSVVTAFAFYRFVEQPAGALTRSR